MLGTLARRAARDGWRVRILSGDRDLFQLVDDERDIAVLYMGGGPAAKQSGPVEVRREQVIARLGVPPEEVVDLKALTGDSSDNIPGVKGVGPKTAITLLRENGDLDGIYAALEALEGPKASKGSLKGALRTKLAADKESAYRSRMLAQILVDIPLPQEPRLGLGQVDQEALTARLEELELFSLKRQAEGFVRLFSLSGGTGGAAPESIEESAATAAPPEAEAGATDADPADTAGDPLPPLRPRLIDTPEALEELRQRLLAATDPQRPVALDTETTA